MAEKELTRVRETEQAFFALLKTSLHGGKAELPVQVAWPYLFRLASQHNVLPLILEAAWQSGVPEELLAPMRPMAMQIVMAQTRRTAAFHSLYRKLAQQGLKPLVLKGLVCRNLYPQPDGRPSCDEDLLIEAAALPAMHKALLGYGLSCDCREPTAQMDEITYSTSDLYLELHLSLFPTDSTAYGYLNAFFAGVHDRSVALEIDGSLIRTLSPTDHLLYLICHAYKHFLHSGVGIRQVCDIAFLAERCGREIDWNHIRKSCDEVRISYFTAALFSITSRYLGFSMPGAFAHLHVDESAMLRDMLSGGVYGAVDENRQHSATITLGAVSRQRRGGRVSGFLNAVFLPIGSMERRYPYLKKYPWLLPAAWLDRVIHYISHLGRGVSPAASIQIGAQRVELLKKYRIIEK